MKTFVVLDPSDEALEAGWKLNQMAVALTILNAVQVTDQLPAIDPALGSVRPTAEAVEQAERDNPELVRTYMEGNFRVAETAGPGLMSLEDFVAQGSHRKIGRRGRRAGRPTKREKELAVAEVHRIHAMAQR